MAAVICLLPVTTIAKHIYVCIHTLYIIHIINILPHVYGQFKKKKLGHYTISAKFQSFFFFGGGGTEIYKYVTGRQGRSHSSLVILPPRSTGQGANTI